MHFATIGLASALRSAWSTSAVRSPRDNFPPTSVAVPRRASPAGLRRPVTAEAEANALAVGAGVFLRRASV
eukprot:378381-Prymnesium_polylepis.2